MATRREFLAAVASVYIGAPAFGRPVCTTIEQCAEQLELRGECLARGPISIPDGTIIRYVSLDYQEDGLWIFKVSPGGFIRPGTGREVAWLCLLTADLCALTADSLR